MKLLKRILCLAIVLATMMSMVLLPIPASAADATMEVVGAAIRTDGGTQALRFVGRIKKESNSYTLTYGNSANFGLILIPKYMVNSETSITKSTSGVLTIKAATAIEYNHPWLSTVGITGVSGYTYFVATVTGIDVSNYKTDFLARVYVNTSYSTQDSRSVYSVANTLGMTDIVTTANNYGTNMYVDVGGM